MASAIARLTDAQLSYQPEPATFQQIAGETLGNAATSSDGFDSIFAVPGSAFDSDAGSVGALDALVSDAAFTVGEFAQANLAPLESDAASFITAGDAISGDLGNAFGGQVTPSNDAPPAPDPCTPTLANPFPCGMGGTGGGDTNPE